MSKTKEYIEERIRIIEEDEKDATEDSDEGMSFSAEDVIQELKWVLERLKKEFKSWRIA